MRVEKSKANYPNGYWAWWRCFEAKIGKIYPTQNLIGDNEFRKYGPLSLFEIVEMTHDGSEIWLEIKNNVFR